MEEDLDIDKILDKPQDMLDQIRNLSEMYLGSDDISKLKLHDSENNFFIGPIKIPLKGFLTSKNEVNSNYSVENCEFVTPSHHETIKLNKLKNMPLIIKAVNDELILVNDLSHIKYLFDEGISSYWSVIYCTENSNNTNIKRLLHNLVSSNLVISDLTKEKACETQTLIFNGLKERWGANFDPSCNNDVKNIYESYIDQKHDFLIGTYLGDVILAGALQRINDDISQIVRVSVDKNYRGIKLGEIIVNSLEKRAKEKRFKKMVLETTNTWISAFKLYEKMGYKFIEERDNERWYEKEL